jgi:hypothetical protein
VELVIEAFFGTPYEKEIIKEYKTFLPHGIRPKF